MEEIISKGYAREAKTNPPDGRTRYLPHHGVYHPLKPSKLRVVFDCSAGLNGRSINKELLSGPDLANKLVGVLTKFRENKVAFMADIEKMQIENKEKFGEEAAQTLQNSFSVDDLLQSVANEGIAVQLIKKVTGMCHEGGFNLTRFTSNSKRVLQSIQEKDRRPGVKDKDLVKDLPEDQVLGILWNIEDDAFGFNVSLKSKPMTRRGALSS